MHRPDPTRRRFDAQLEVQVPRNAGGTLEEGVAAMVEGVDSVRRVETVDLEGLIPRLNDLAVEANVEGVLETTPGEAGVEADLAAALEDTFGIANVEACRVTEPVAGEQPPVMDYG